MADGSWLMAMGDGKAIDHRPYAISHQPLAMFTDLRQALRLLLKSPGFSALIVVVLALGIGANTAIFSIVNGVLFKPLPFADAARLVAIDTTVRNEPDDSAYLDVLDWHAQASTVERIAGLCDRRGHADRTRRGGVGADGGGDPRHFPAARRRADCRPRARPQRRPARRRADGGDLRNPVDAIVRPRCIHHRQAGAARRRPDRDRRRDAGAVRVSVRRREPVADLDAGAGVALLGAVGRSARRVVPEGDRPAASRRRAAGGAVRAVGDCRADRRSQPAQRHARHRGSSISGCPRQQLPAGADRAARRGGGGAADRVREHRQPAAGARHLAAAGDGGPHRARREPRTDRAPAADREPDARRDRRRGGNDGRAVGRGRAGPDQPGADSAAQHASRSIAAC